MNKFRELLASSYSCLKIFIRDIFSEKFSSKINFKIRKFHWSTFLFISITGSFLIYCSIFGSPFAAKAAAFTSVQSGNWNDQCTWSATCDGGLPTSSDNVTIASSHTVTVTSGNPVNLGVGALSVDGALVLNDAITLGDLNIAAGATINTNGSGVTVGSIINSGTFTAGSSVITVSNNFSNIGTFNSDTSVITFNATTTGKLIKLSNSTLNDVVFNGVGGGWSFFDTAVLNGDLTLSAGTLSGAGNIFVKGGAMTGNGTLNMTSGRIQIEGTGDFGGGTDWTFSNLTFGDGSASGTTSKTGANKIIVKEDLKISTSHTLAAGSSTWNLSWGSSTLSNITQIAGGFGHALALDDSGGVWAWGSGSYGQLGQGLLLSGSDYPVRVLKGAQTGSDTYLEGISKIFCGRYHSIAIDNTGFVYAWGRNNSGQLGDGSTGNNKSSPVQVLRGEQAGDTYLSNIFSVGGGGDHTIAIDNTGAVYSWGNNYYGQLGIGTSGAGTNKTSPVRVLRGAQPGDTYLSNITQVAGGSSHTLALDNTGAVYSWGYNYYGSLGIGTSGSGTDKTTPVQVLRGEQPGDTYLSGIIQVVSGYGSASYDSVAVLDNTGAVYTWGYNYYGQLGIGTSGAGTNKTSPVRVLKGEQTGDTYLSAITQIAGGDNHILALDDAGQVWAWGKNADAELGNGTLTNSSAPVHVLKGEQESQTYLSNIVQISASGTSSFGLESSGTVYVLDRYFSQTPKKVLKGQQTGSTPFLNDIVEVASGDGHTLALDNSGQVWAWGGYNSYGLLGNGTFIESSTPVKVVKGEQPGGDPYLSNIVHIACGYWHSVAVDNTGAVYAWGDNYQGELGGVTAETVVASPVRVLRGEQSGDTYLSGITEITAGEYITAALDNTGAVYAWGYNYYGQLGIGTSGNGTNKSAPARVLKGEQAGDTYLSNISHIGAGESHMVAVDNAGDAYSWGYNYYGQLGIGTSGSGTDKTTPTRILKGEQAGDVYLDNISHLSAGLNFSLALDSTGAVYAWGDNYNGQLGNGNTTKQPLPVRVLKGEQAGDTYLSNITQISSGYGHNAAIDNTGAAYAWGDNYYGQLGNGLSGSGTDKATPIRILKGDQPGDIYLSNITQVAAGTGGNLTTVLDSSKSIFITGYGYLLPTYPKVPLSNPIVIEGSLDYGTSTFELTDDHTAGKPSMLVYENIPAATFDTFTLDNPDQIYTLTGTLNTKDLTINNGQLDATRSNHSINISGNYSNSGTGKLKSRANTITLNGSASQSFTAGGTDPDYTPYNLTVANTGGPTDGVTFTDDLTLSAGGTLTDVTPDSKVTFTDGATYTLPNININGTNNHPITLTTPAGVHGHSHFNVAQASPTATYVAVDHSDATGSSAAIDATLGGIDNNFNTNWLFGGTPPVINDTISGSLFDSVAGSKIGAAKNIKVSINGNAPLTGTTSSGDYTIDTGTTLYPNDVVVAFVDDETVKASTVTKVSTSGNLTSFDLSQNHTTIRHEGATTSITNTDLAIADNLADTDELFTVDGSNKASFTNGLHIANGKNYAPGGDIDIAGDWRNDGVFSHGGNTVNFTKDSGTQTLKSGGTDSGKSFNHLTHSGNGTIQLSTDDLDVDGDLTNSAGVFEANDRNIKVGKDWNNTATFTPGTAKVTLDSTNPAHVHGSSSFYDFTIDTSVDGAKSVNFDSASTQTISHTLTLVGGFGKVLTLGREGGSGNDLWYLLIPSPVTSGSYLAVSNGGSGNEHKITAGSHSQDNGNNPGWIFPVEAAEPDPDPVLPSPSPTTTTTTPSDSSDSADQTDTTVPEQSPTEESVTESSDAETLPSSDSTTEDKTSTQTDQTSSNTGVPLVDNIIEAVKETNQTISDVVHLDEKTVPIIVTVAVIVTATASAASTPIGNNLTLLTIPEYFRSLFYTLFSMSAKRKRKEWGKVLEAGTGLPVAQAKVNLIKIEKLAAGKEDLKKIVASTYTARDGSYAFLADPGEYKLLIEKDMFSVMKVPGYYFNEVLHIKNDKDSLIVPTIIVSMEQNVTLVKQNFLHKLEVFELVTFYISFTLMIIGTISVISFLLKYPPTTLAIIIAALYPLFWYIAIKSLLRVSPIGNVKDFENKRGVPLALIRVMDSTGDRLVKTAVSNENGKYKTLINRGTYQVNVSKIGYIQLAPLKLEADKNINTVNKTIEIKKY